MSDLPPELKKLLDQLVGDLRKGASQTGGPQFLGAMPLSKLQEMMSGKKRQQAKHQDLVRETRSKEEALIKELQNMARLAGDTWSEYCFTERLKSHSEWDDYCTLQSKSFDELTAKHEEEKNKLMEAQKKEMEELDNSLIPVKTDTASKVIGGLLNRMLEKAVEVGRLNEAHAEKLRHHVELIVLNHTWNGTGKNEDGCPHLDKHLLDREVFIREMTSEAINKAIEDDPLFKEHWDKLGTDKDEHNITMAEA